MGQYCGRQSEDLLLSPGVGECECWSWGWRQEGRDFSMQAEEIPSSAAALRAAPEGYCNSIVPQG